MASFEICLESKGSAIMPAERAILQLQVESQLQDTAAEATAALTSNANKIRNMILPHCSVEESTGKVLSSEPISHYSMGVMQTSTHPQKPKENDPQQTRTYFYSARTSFNIKFRDFALLNQIATELSAMNCVKISCIEWKLTDTTLESIKMVARKAAARDAMARAIDYAEVFCNVGPEGVSPISMKESQYYAQSNRPQLHLGKGLRTWSDGTGPVIRTGEQEVNIFVFEPEDVRLEASLEVKFSVTTPRRGLVGFAG